MPLLHIEHMLVKANDIEETRDWYEQVLGMEVGEHPDFGIPVYWLYLDGRDVIHIVQAESPEAVEAASRENIAAGGRPIHHVAFRAEGLDETLSRLESLGVPWVEQQAGSQSLYQVFVRDPNGITVELNFAAAEAAGREVPRLALALDRQQGEDG